MKQVLINLASRLGYRITKSSLGFYTAEDYQRLKREKASWIEECYRLASTSRHVLPEFDEARIDRMSDLTGLSPAQAILLLSLIHETKSLGGDYCELGVAAGDTTKMIAAEIPDSHLWLYDSFEGLPAPTEKDELIDDVYGLGDIAKYAGTMSNPQTLVMNKLAELNFPTNQLRIVAGFVEQTLSDQSNLPAKVAFAFIDMDFYEPIKVALAAFSDRLVPGGVIAVHDYDHFSSGAKTAVDEFVAASGDRFDFQFDEAVPAICVLHRKL